MTNKQLKNLKDTLWTTADQLRANSGLKSTEYAEPILGLIFLRFADVKYSKYEPAIQAEFDSIKGTRMERPIHEIAIEKCGFYLPEEARYDWLLNLPESEDLAKKVKEAMEAVEKYTSELEDTLPKDIYYSVNSEDDPLVLAKLLKNFKDIPADVELEIIPGVTAALGGGAVLGAPLIHDFCLISLSDLLTPWETIEKSGSSPAGGQ